MIGSGEGNRSLSDNGNVRSQSPARSRNQSSVMREGNPRPGIQNQSSFRTKSSATPESMGISLEDDGSVFENLPHSDQSGQFTQLSRSTQSSSGISRGDDLSLSYSMDESMNNSAYISAASVDQSGQSTQRSRSTRSILTKESSRGSLGGRSGTSRRDDLSLSYSVGDESMSRTSTYISAESSKSEDSQRKFAKVPVQYHPPRLPPQVEEVAKEEPSFIGAFMKTPLEYIKKPLEYVFGENDDDVSTLGGFNESYAWDGDNSTIATTPTMKRDLSMQHQPTIFEGDEEDGGTHDEEGEYEDYDEGQRLHTIEEQPSVIEDELTELESYADVSTANKSQDDRSKPPGGLHRSTQSVNTESISPLTLVRGDYDNYDDEEEVETFKESHSFPSQIYGDQASQMDHTRGDTVSTITNDPYLRQQERSEGIRTTSELKSIVEDVESMAESYMEPDEFTTAEQHTVKFASDAKSYASSKSGSNSRTSGYFDGKDSQSIHSYSKPQQPMHSETGSIRSVYSDTYDDRSLNSGYTSAYKSVGSDIFSQKRREEWNKSDDASVRSSRSEMWHKNTAANKSWRNAKSAKGSSQFSGGQSVVSYHTNHTSASAMPEVPEVIREGDASRPTMTRGMSGRAVVHVKMNSTSDGTIEDLSYTMPLIDDSKSDNATVMTFDDERSSGEIPWFDYYLSRYNIIRICYAKQCYRTMAVILMIFAIAFGVLISLITHVSGINGNTNSSSHSKLGSSLDDLRKPEEFNTVHFSGPVNKHLANWYRKEGDYWAQDKDVPFFVDIPMVGSYTFLKSWGECLGLTIASNQVREVENTLREESILGVNYVVVDLGTRHGIKHAARLDLVPSGVPDIVISPRFLDTVEILFSNQHKSKFILTLRDPIQRSIATFEYLKNENPEVATLAIEQFAQSRYIENNYVTRLLTGKSTGVLSRKDVDFCKELLRRKAIIGLYEKIEEALKHFELYLGWSPSTSHALNCQARAIADALNDKPSIQIDEASAAYTLIRQQNIHDISLYNYAKNVLVPYQQEVIRRQTRSRSAENGGSISL